MTNNATFWKKIILLKIDLDNSEEYINKLFDIYKNQDKINNIIIHLIEKPMMKIYLLWKNNAKN